VKSRRRRASSGTGLILATVIVALIGIGLAALFAALRPASHQTPLGPGRTHPAAHASSASSPARDPSSSAPAAAAKQATPPPLPLAGKVVGIDPGHNGANGANPAYINQMIWNGRASETCDTTGTATNGGYTEAQFNFDVAQYLRADLRREGARVVLTRTTNSGVGPCVDRRAAILNKARSNVAIDIHADGGPPWGRGFSILEPVADGPNNNVIASSAAFGTDVQQAMLKYTGMPVSNYYGQGGIEPRSDLAGLNLATEPKILIECGNMRNGTDAQLLTSPAFQKRLAAAFTAAITRFLTHP
jgi:N-acetylmuramoyl-L-alanine amidase